MGIFGKKKVEEKPPSINSSSDESPEKGVEQVNEHVNQHHTNNLVPDFDDIYDEMEIKETHDLPLEQYMYYANIQREYEYRKDFDGLRENQMKQLADPHGNMNRVKIESQRELRKANRYAVFFLITTDILGPSNAPYGLAQLGYVGGIILYVAFGFFALLGGKLLQNCFLRLDSDNYPIRTFSDLGARIFGYWSRYFVAGLQFIQMILNVGIICLSSGQALAQCIGSTDDNPKVCFTVQILFWALAGMVLGQIRSLRDYSYIANSAVWMNIAICVITMAGAYMYDPYGPATGWAPGDKIIPTAGTKNGLFDQMLGVDQMVFAWGGATIFCELMAEMANPREFIQGLMGADGLILVVYLFFGIFTYTCQGQYVSNPANQGIQTYKLRLASNVLSLVSGVFAAALYGNVGLKVLYQGFGVPDLKFPVLTSKKGAVLWAGLVFIYWSVAYIIGAAIPQVSALSALVGSLCILNFSYTLPAGFMLTLMMREDAGQHDTYHPETATIDRIDSWKDGARWKRAITSGTWKRQTAKFFLLIMTLGGLCLCGIGLYGAIKSMIKTYSSASNAGKAFGCSPANYN